MHERDPATAGPAPGDLIDELVSLCPARLERLIEVTYAVANMMDTGSASRQKLCDGPIGSLGSEELDVGVAERKRRDHGAVRLLLWKGSKPEDVAIEAQRSFEIGYGNPNVGDASGIRHGYLVGV